MYSVGRLRVATAPPDSAVAGAREMRCTDIKVSALVLIGESVCDGEESLCAGEDR
jgi:hypothetical protein